MHCVVRLVNLALLERHLLSVHREPSLQTTMTSRSYLTVALQLNIAESDRASLLVLCGNASVFMLWFLRAHPVMQMNRLKLNTDKTQFIWLGTAAQLTKINTRTITLADADIPKCLT